jgi:hypothetical protein
MFDRLKDVWTCWRMDWPYEIRPAEPWIERVGGYAPSFIGWLGEVKTRDGTRIPMVNCDPPAQWFLQTPEDSPAHVVAYRYIRRLAPAVAEAGK